VDFDAEMKGLARAIMGKMFQEIFGIDAIKGLSDDNKKFLEIGTFDPSVATDDLDL
jgi:hypothetical protein